MTRSADDRLVSDRTPAEPAGAAGPSGRWVRIGAAAGLAALALARLSGVALAAPSASGAASAGLDDAASLDGATLALAPEATLDHLALASPVTAKTAKTARTPRTPKTPKTPVTATAPTPPTVDTSTAGTAPTATADTATVPTAGTVTAPTDGTATVPTPGTGTPGTAATAGTPTPGTSGTEHGLHLGQIWHAGLSDAQAQALAEALGGGLTADDVRAMTLGELLSTAHAAGLSTAEVVEVLRAAE